MKWRKKWNKITRLEIELGGMMYEIRQLSKVDYFHTIISRNWYIYNQYIRKYKSKCMDY